jgi:two-component system KDP operon response regulator KdpE
MRSQVQMSDGEAGHRGVRHSILVVDADPAIRRLLRRELTAAGYRVQDVEPGQGALECVAAHQYDLVVLDIDSPAGGGSEAVRAVRDLSPMPILALSVRGEEDAMVKVLEIGADDFVRKPFGMKELLARVKNALRRRALEQGRPAQVVSGDLEIDLLQRRIRSRGHEVHLPLRCYEVLRMLAERPGKVLTHEEILCAVWGPSRVDRVQYLRLAIRELRSRLELDPAHPRHILTETGVGYRLDVPHRGARGASRGE